MISIEYGPVQTDQTLYAKDYWHIIKNDPQCPECLAYAGWHRGDCPEWKEIVMKQVRLADAERS